jgi:5-methyltetrahydropteroyltriglutamate--homocysteine methyltransferase
MKLTVLGSYPRIPAHSGPSVRTAFNRFDRGQLSPAALEQVVREVTAGILDLARIVGLDTTTDGQVRWHDLTDPIVRDVENLNPGGLQRFFNNNFYYRRPTVVGRLWWTGGALAEWTRIARALAPDLGLKVALPGPLTLAHLAEDLSYGDRARLLADLVDVLKLEAESVARTGVVEIQWDEPAAVAGGGISPAEALAVWRDLLDGAPPVARGLALYFGSAGPWIDTVQQLDVRRVYLDLAGDPTPLDRLAAEAMPWEVGLGLLNAREVRLEPADAVARAVERVAERQGGERVWLHPSAGLEWLPPDWARRKLEHLATVRELVDGAPAGRTTTHA